MTRWGIVRILFVVTLVGGGLGCGESLLDDPNASATDPPGSSPSASEAAAAMGAVAGEQVVRASDGTPLETTRWRFGKRDGTTTGWSPTGAKLIEEAWRTGVRHGRWTRWFPDSALKAEAGYYLDGMRHRRWVRWNAAGTVAEVTCWADGAVQWRSSVSAAAQRACDGDELAAAPVDMPEPAATAPEPAAAAPIATAEPIAAAVPASETVAAAKAPGAAEPPKDVAARLGKIPSDAPPAKRAKAIHYVVSNEFENQSFATRINSDGADLGGIYVGVGAEQNYIFAGWARPAVILLMDYDDVVVDLHGAYEVAFLSAASPEAFVDRWSEASEADMVRRIEARFGGQSEPVLRAFRFARARVAAHLRRSSKRYERAKVATLLSDSEQYAFVRGLFESGRVRRIRGDLLGDATMHGIAAAARDLRMPVRAVYVSNSEQYFDFEASYRKNMLALPFDGRSVVLRTLARSGGRYEYIRQPALGFQEWLRDPDVKNVWAMRRGNARRIEGAYHELNALPASTGSADQEPGREDIPGQQ